MDIMRFELKLAETPVTLVSVDGEEKDYILRELSGEKRDDFLNNVGKRTIPGVDNKLNDFKDHQAVLINKCLFTAEGVAVSIPEIRAFPANVQKELFLACREISGLDMV